MATFVTGLHGDEAVAAFYAEGLTAAGAPAPLRDAVAAASPQAKPAAPTAAIQRVR